MIIILKVSVHTSGGILYMKNLLKRVPNIFEGIVYRIALFIFSFFPINRKSIVIDNFSGLGYSGNPKYIIDQMLRNYPQYVYIWLVDNKKKSVDFPEKIKCIRTRSIAAAYYLETARVWIDSTRKTLVRKRKQQVYINTWHGGLGFKLVEAKANNLSPKYVYWAKKDAKNIDLMVSNGKRTSALYNEMFWYDGPVIEVGLPRNDQFFDDNPQLVTNIKQSMGLDPDTRIVLYAPTFRDDESVSAYDIDMTRMVEVLQKKFGGKWKGAVRLHPNVSTKELNNKSLNDCINMNAISDINQVLRAVDILISDYSSIVFDFVLQKKLAILYASDYEEYKKTRGLWLTYDEVPFITLYSNDAIENSINSLDMDNYCRELQIFMKRNGMNETGRSSYILAKYIDSIMRGENVESALQKIGDGYDLNEAN